MRHSETGGGPAEAPRTADENREDGAQEPDGRAPVSGAESAGGAANGGGADGSEPPGGPVAEDPAPGGAGGTAQGPGTVLPHQAERQPARPPSGLSPSRAADFMTCPLLYRFRVIDRLPEPPSPAATRGTVVHAVLERLFDAPAAERTPDRARALLRPQWERLLTERPELAGLFPADDDGSALARWLADAERLLEGWFRLEDPTRLEPAEREMYVETALESGLRLRGYIDRVDVAPTGEIRVVDYKTGRAPARDFEGKAMFQMKFYALVLWRLRGVVPRRLQLVYLGSGDLVTYDPDEADLRAVERKLEALWAAITRATETGEWRPSPSRLCDWCDHRSRCPSFGGTPPPYPLAVPPAAVRPAAAAPA